MDIQLKLGVTFKPMRGSHGGRREAATFIARYMPALKEYNENNHIEPPPTGKQVRYIRAIEDELDVCFRGETLVEASEFIGFHAEAFKISKKEINI